MEKFNCNDQRSIKEKVKEKIDNVKRNVVTTATSVSKWCSEHKELVVAVSPGLIDSIGRIYVEHGRNKRWKSEVNRVRNEVYDNRAGKWYHHKTMNKKQILEFTRRKYSGEPVGEILNDMRLLRK